MGGFVLGTVNATGLLCLLSVPAVAGLVAWPRIRRRLLVATGRLNAFRTHCRNCGYDLRGITSPQCPECGTVRETHKTPVEIQAMDIVARAKARFERPLLYRPAIETDFAGHDRDYYEATTEQLAKLQYRPAGDLVRIGMVRGKPPVVRTFVAKNGQTCVLVYHVPPRRAPARLQGVPLRLCEAHSEFTDGRFLETTNTEGVFVSTAPPEILRQRLPLGTDALFVLEEHERRRREQLAHANGSCVCYATFEDVIAGQERQQQLQLAFRRRIGYVDPEEIRRQAILDGSTERAAGQLAKAIDRVRRKYATGLEPEGRASRPVLGP